jgi:hypothetical protein
VNSNNSDRLRIHSFFPFSILELRPTFWFGGIDRAKAAHRLLVKCFDRTSDLNFRNHPLNDPSITATKHKRNTHLTHPPPYYSPPTTVCSSFIKMAEADSKPLSLTQDTPATEPKVATEATKVEAADGASDAKDTESKPITEKAGAAASAMKDNVFSMFGGGPKKEKKEEEDAVDEPSGSSKAQPKDEVRYPCRNHPDSDVHKANTSRNCRKRIPKPLNQTPTSSLLSTSLKRSRPRRTKNWRRASSRCAPSCSSLTARAGSGRSGVLATSGC